ncbi:MAG: flavodoxin family protein [Lachnospiraceae bacterium]|nr:flavodoxin family protein [Lachnospiraceae bacterium]
MHVLIINGSPRIKKYSNTDKILSEFTKGMCEKGDTFDLYEISDKKSWDNIRKAYDESDNILIALPLYVECIPGLLMEFLETLTPKTGGAKMSFILQSGFAEGVQLRCGEAYLERLAGRLGCEYGGTLCKGGNFEIRFLNDENRVKATSPYGEMGREFSANGNFNSDKCKAFTGPEIFPAPVRLMVGFFFRTAVRKSFMRDAESLGCTKPLDYKPYT